MKEKQSISFVKSGMERDTNISQLKNTDYTIGVNINTSNETGDSFSVQLEPSNYYGVKFTIGYKVIGFRNDNIKNRTYYFLTNVTTNTASLDYKRSSIGYVDNTINETFNQDTLTNICHSCDKNNIIEAPLENVVQVPSQTYVELVHDRCIPAIDIEEKGLNFNINFPILKVELKQEKLNTQLYWDDYRNYFRYLNVTNIEEARAKNTFDYLHSEDIPCIDPIETPCLQVDKLLVEPKHTRIVLEAKEVQTGGSLKMGTYEFYPAYCDLMGNEMSQYATPTNPISIFDENNNILSQTETDSFTNFAIKIKVKNLDVKHFKYYKIAVVERNNVGNTQSVFLVGIYPTTDDTVVYSTSGSSNDDLYMARGNVAIRKRMDFNTLTAVKQKYKRAKGTMVSADILHRYGLEVEEELNIQPVVNLLSALHWQTSVAKEDLYANPIATSLYKHYMPNEVQTFAIRLLYTDGGYSSNFPFIGRPSTPTDLQVITDKNYQSLLKNAPKCITNERNKRWQIFNTAKEYEEQCSSFDDGVYLTQTENIVKTCDIIGVATILAPDPLIPIIIEVDSNYTDLATYVDENYDEITNPSSDLYIPQIAGALLNTYPLNHCTPSFGNSCNLPPNLDSFKNKIGYIDYTLTIGTPLVVGKDYIINTLSTGDDFTNIGFLKIKEYFTATGATPTNWTSTEVLLRDKKLIESIFPTDYEDTILKNTCRIYKSGNSSGVEIDQRANPDKQPEVGVSYFSRMPCGYYVVKREQQQNLTPTTPDSIQNIIVNSNSYLQNYFNDYDLSENINDLIDYSTRNANPIASGFYNKLAKKALWFKNENTKNRFIFEITPQKVVETIRDNISSETEVRLSFYTKKSDINPFFTTLVDLTFGAKFLFQKTLTGYSITSESGVLTPISISNTKFLVAVDCRINSQMQSEIIFVPLIDSYACINRPDLIAYRIAPTNGCYSIVTRNIEYSHVELNWNTIKINKTETYSSSCQFKIPKVDSCKVKPYKRGSFSYWQSTELYADNKQLYDSSSLKINPLDLNNLTYQDKSDFIKRYSTYGLVPNNSNIILGNYYLVKLGLGDNFSNIAGFTDEKIFLATSNQTPIIFINSEVFKINADSNSNIILVGADFRCQPIRHFKMPDNTVAPFMIDIPNYQKNAESIIFPLGVNIDSKAVSTILDISVKNKLITQKQRNNIQGYEILRGDNTIHKSVIANGIASDMYNYQEGNKKVYYSNYPFNDLGNNKFAFERGTNNLIKHPYNGLKNHLFAFMSPDTYLTKPSIPTEVSLQGFQLGSCDTGFASVNKHPKWTVLGDNAKRTAEQLAIAEAALELVIKTSELIANSGIGHSWVLLGVPSGTNAVGTALSTGALVAYIVGAGIASFMKIGKYRYDWLKIFRDLGRMDNFAEFQYSYGKHNRFLKTNQNSPNYLRALTVRKYLGDSRYNIVDENDGSNIKVNNWLREQSILLSTGIDFTLNYPIDYINFDNNTVNSNSSGFVKSEVGCDFEGTSTRDIASPYLSLKNYIPDQWGTLDSIKWLTTNYIFDLRDDTTCKPIYGGTVCISRFSVRKKVPLFEKNDIRSADKLPFKYSKYSNIGTTRFFCDYETENDGIYQGTGLPFPDIATSLSGFDCIRGNRGFYVEPPSKFYLFVHGVSDFLVQSEINCNFRYSGKEPQDKFYQKQDLAEWLQETNLPIVEPNTFYYNNTYTLPVSNTPFKYFDRTYDKEIWSKRNQQHNARIWSQRDINENDLTDPWRVFKPLNFEETSTENGRLVDCRDLESGQFYARYENALHLYSEMQDQSQRITSQNRELGTSFLYGRPTEIKTTDLGFAGTQNTDFVSTPYGHFSVDAKRGRIIKSDSNGGGIEVISETIQGKPSGIKQWFREHLPFKILKYIPNLNINNKFKGIGINIWYDDRNSRIFFTKRDYILKVGVDKNRFKYNEVTQQLLFNNVEVFFDNTTLFKDVSWTIAYKPTEGAWNSYFTFYPDYSPQHQNYFQAGYNWGQDKGTLWNHLMNNQSFGVFQGRFNTSLIEYPIANENVNKILNSISINSEARRYSSQWDYSVDKNIGFNYLNIWNNTNNSGQLSLNPQKTLADNRKYPITNGNIQEIMFTSDEDKQNVNYFYNRLVNQDNNIPMFIKDENNIFKAINPNAVKFTGKRSLERIKGDTFMVTLSNTKNSRHNIILENVTAKENIYE